MQPNDAPSNQQGLTTEGLGRATRFALGMIVIVFTYFPFQISFAIPKFEKIFEDMLGAGSRLPLMSRFIFAAAPAVMTLTSVMFATAVLVLFLRRIKLALYIQGILAFLAVVVCVAVYQGVFGPFTEIIRRMQGAPPSFDPASLLE
jgi:hypothetical protein